MGRRPSLYCLRKVVLMAYFVRPLDLLIEISRHNHPRLGQPTKYKVDHKLQVLYILHRLPTCSVAYIARDNVYWDIPNGYGHPCQVLRYGLDVLLSPHVRGDIPSPSRVVSRLK